MICDHYECAALFEKCKRFIGRSRPVPPASEELCKECPNATCNHCFDHKGSSYFFSGF